MKRAIACLALAVAVAACGETASNEEKPEEQQPPVHTEPSWEGLRIGGSAASDHFGETLCLAPGVFGAAASPGVVHAGRELLAVGADGETLWRTTWTDVPSTWTGAHRAVDVVTIPGMPTDLLLIDDHGEVRRIDGRDGSTVWGATLENDRVARGTALVGSGEDAVFVSSFGSAARSVANGAIAWRFPGGAEPVFVATVRTDDRDVLVAALDHQGTVLAPNVLVLSPQGEVLADRSSGGWVTALGVARKENGAFAVVGGDRGTLQAIGADGGLVWSKSFEIGGNADVASTYVELLVARDLDGDGTDELLFTLAEINRPERTHLVIADAAGEERWRVLVGESMPALDALVQDGAPIVVGLLRGWGVVGLQPTVEAGADPVLWMRTTPLRFTSVAFAPDGSLVVGAEDGTLRSLDPASGEPLQERYAGFFLAPAAVVADGLAIAGDEAGRLVARRFDGTLAWTHVLDEETWSYPLEAAQFESEGETRIAVITMRGAEPPAMLHVVRASGEPVAALPFEFAWRAMELGDFDADGRPEVIGVGLDPAYFGRVVAVDLATPVVRWVTELPRCQYGDVHATAEGIAVACYTSGALPLVVLLDHEGAARWQIEVDEQPLWVRMDGTRVITGGLGADGEGVVVARDLGSGDTLWSTALPWISDPADKLRRIPGASWFGELAGDRDGDGAAEIAVTTQASRVALLDGATGAKRWELPITSEKVAPTAMHYGGPIALVPGGETAPPYLLVAQGAWDAADSTALAVSLDGEVLATFDHEGAARGVAVGEDEDGRLRALVVRTLGTTVYGVEGAAP